MKLSAIALLLVVAIPAWAARPILSADGKYVVTDSGTIPISADGEPARILAAELARNGMTAPDPYVAPPPAVPQTVSAMQAKVALSRAGLLDAVSAWVATQNAETQLIWSTAPTFSRNSTMLNGAAGALSLTSAQVDQLFAAAAAINP